MMLITVTFLHCMFSATVAYCKTRPWLAGMLKECVYITIFCLIYRIRFNPHSSISARTIFVLSQRDELINFLTEIVTQFIVDQLIGILQAKIMKISISSHKKRDRSLHITAARNNHLWFIARVTREDLLLSFNHKLAEDWVLDFSLNKARCLKSSLWHLTSCDGRFLGGFYISLTKLSIS